MAWSLAAKRLKRSRAQPESHPRPGWGRAIVRAGRRLRHAGWHRDVQYAPDTARSAGSARSVRLSAVDLHIGSTYIYSCTEFSIVQTNVRGLWLL
jgi:hypothetical protein